MPLKFETSPSVNDNSKQIIKIALKTKQPMMQLLAGDWQSLLGVTKWYDHPAVTGSLTKFCQITTY